MRSLHRLVLLAALTSAAATTTSPSRADAPAGRLTRLMTRSVGTHPLATPQGKVPMTALLPTGANATALGLVEVAPGVGAVRLYPEQVDAFEAASGLHLLASPPRRPLMETASQLWTKAKSYREQTGEDGTGVVVGVIDTGIDFYHPQFRNADGSTRIAWLLTSGNPAGLHPDLEQAYGCAEFGCAIYSEEDINGFIAAATIPEDARDLVGHGTHVTSIATGNGGPLVYPPNNRVGVAPGATIVVAAPSAGAAFFDGDLVNAARFVFDRADDLGMPCALNMSVGSDFGPHDGTSSLERGLAALVGDDKPGRVLVVAAGNSGSLFSLSDGTGPLGIHTEARATDGGETRVPIVAPGAKGGQVFIWITFRPGDDVSVGLEGPGGEDWTSMVSPGDDEGYESGDGGTTAAVINNKISNQSSITSETNSAVIAWDGDWPQDSEFAVRLRGTGDAQLWMVGQKGLDRTGVFFAKALKQGTVAVPASDPNLLAVGCTLNRLSWAPLVGPRVQLESLGGVSNPPLDTVCYFSAAGPTPLGVPKPELVAPGAFVVAAMSRDADPRVVEGSMFDAPGCSGPDDKCYVVDDYHAISSGTSMAAPQVTGAAALLLQHDPTLTQSRATAILQAGARYPQGSVPLDYQVGAGALNLEGALQVLADEEARGGPDSAASWWVLSSGYVRPDPTWPVWGTVELRHADGTVASGLSASLLKVSIDNGELVEPVEKIRHGLFRFAVAGARGTGGQNMTITVSYDGTVIQHSRTMAIATDAWMTDGRADALGGGCACDVVGPASSSRNEWPLAVVGLGMVMLVRRRGVVRRQGLVRRQQRLHSL